MNDNSIMPFGIHKGKPMIDVPAGYLLWLYKQISIPADLKRYIEDNLEVLKKENDQK